MSFVVLSSVVSPSAPEAELHAHSHRNDFLPTPALVVMQLVRQLPQFPSMSIHPSSTMSFVALLSVVSPSAPEAELHAHPHCDDFLPPPALVVMQLVKHKPSRRNVDGRLTVLNSKACGPMTTMLPTHLSVCSSQDQWSTIARLNERRGATQSSHLHMVVD